MNIFVNGYRAEVLRVPRALNLCSLLTEYICIVLMIPILNGNLLWLQLFCKCKVTDRVKPFSSYRIV
jgi:hypothetical protein